MANHTIVRRDATILFVTNVYHPTVGGITKYIDCLCAGLTDYKLDYRVISFPARLNSFPRSVRWIFYLIFCLWILAYSSTIRFVGKRSIVHSHSASFCLVAAVICRYLTGAFALHTFHSPITRRSLVLKWFVEHVDEIIYVSEATRSLYRRFQVPLHASEHIIPGGIDLTVFDKASASRVESMADLLFVGRICEEKGVRELLSAIEEMNADIAVRIVGAPQTNVQKLYYIDLLCQTRASTRLSTCVTFSGQLDGKDLVDSYVSAKILVLPSLCDEAAPMVIAEAMAGGLPVVAFDVGGLRERIDSGVDGILVPKGDIAALSRALENLIENSQQRSLMAENARARAKREFSQTAMIDRYLKVYGFNLQ